MEPGLRLVSQAMAGAVVVCENVEVFTGSIPRHRSADERRLMYCKGRKRVRGRIRYGD